MRSLLFLLIPVFVFPISVSQILNLWESSEYIASRYFVEESKYPKMRYEKVYKKGEDKLVIVQSPEEVVWYRKDGECWMGKSVLYLVPSGIKDLEDIAIEALKTAEKVDIAEGDGWYVLEYSSDKGNFTVEIDEAGVPMKIIRKIDGITMKMFFEVESYDVGNLKEFLRGRKLSDELAFPRELGNILKLFDWFTVSEIDGRLRIEGLIKGIWHDVEVGSSEFEGAIRYGRIYIRADSEVLRELESGSD